MSKDFKEFLPWLLFIALLFAIAYVINLNDEVKAKENFQFEVEQCMKNLRKNYKECKEIIYESN
ncbi:hypothetical protein [Pasteurella multocida]|uniref:hypothetical protein n=1 Tax=Pasteurella multocida TaxID=747 RepID=UPI00094B7225|nr:hypothetical protein [Pasteurella multocida]MBF6981535.1 hypothetical protein [Pasteurella multocida]MBF6986011.1 hypothetical protein [Pasteurella multocida]MCL7793531.1 hypothetical protein [Pasteurella multocida]MDA5609261.1 hypothetical protein [Pasteurella multocida subsp. multocida]MDA5611793.1 hypothetical protein [Pasteurella multocida]